VISIDLYIESTIEQEDDEPQIITQRVKGKLECKGEEWVIRYVEEPGTDDEMRTSVKSSPDQLTITRHGLVSYRQTYCPGKRLESIVHTPAGVTEMEVMTLYYERERDERVGKIEFAFLLHMGQQYLGRYQLSLKWMEDQKDESA
jgi:uncharacterized beta-barrel protein YwiB (DUF1934 family)